MILAETTNGVTTKYWQAGDTIAQNTGPDTRFLAYDGLGSMRQMTDGADLTFNQTFDPYGNPYADSTSATAPTNLGFTGETTDANGLVFLRARYYNPQTGQFMQGDPARAESNLYGYGRGNPISNTDPTGLRIDDGCGDYHDYCIQTEYQAGLDEKNYQIALREGGEAWCQAHHQHKCLSDTLPESVAFTAVAFTGASSIEACLAGCGAAYTLAGQGLGAAVETAGVSLSQSAPWLVTGASSLAVTGLLAPHVMKATGAISDREYQDIGNDFFTGNMLGWAELAASPRDSGPMSNMGRLAQQGFDDNTIDDVVRIIRLRQLQLEKRLLIEDYRIAAEAAGTQYWVMLQEEEPYIYFNEKHGTAFTGTVDGTSYNSHHPLQQALMEQRGGKLGGSKYSGYGSPTVTLESGPGSPHDIISSLQNARWKELRFSSSGRGQWATSIDMELRYIVSDFRQAGFTDMTIQRVLQQQYDYLNFLGVQYSPVPSYYFSP